MKHLKTFEGFGHLDFDNSLFKQINYGDFEEMVSSKSLEKSCTSEKVTDGDVEWFSNLIKANIFETFSLESSKKVKRLGTDKIESVIVLKLVPKFGNDWTEILLYKFEDEWWVVECMEFYFQGGSDWTYWACDTKQGVEEWCKEYFKQCGEHLLSLKNNPIKEAFSGEEPLYWEIDMLNPTEKDEVRVSDSIINKIREKLLPEFTITRHGTWFRINIMCKPDCPACNYKRKISDLFPKIPKHNPEADFFVDIFQLDDEWFDIEYLDARHKNYGKTHFNSHYYRCDSLDGVLQFLKDEKIIE